MIGEKKERTSPSTYPLLGIFAHHIRAYALHGSEHARQRGVLTEQQWYARLLHSPFAHIRAYAIRPYSLRRKTYTK